MGGRERGARARIKSDLPRLDLNRLSVFCDAGTGFLLQHLRMSQTLMPSEHGFFVTLIRLKTLRFVLPARRCDLAICKLDGLLGSSSLPCEAHSARCGRLNELKNEKTQKNT